MSSFPSMGGGSGGSSGGSGASTKSITHIVKDDKLSTVIANTDDSIVTSNEVTIGGASSDDVTDVSMDLMFGALTTTITKESGAQIKSEAVMIPDGGDFDRIESISNEYADNQLVTVITFESGTEIFSEPVTISGSGEGYPSNPTFDSITTKTVLGSDAKRFISFVNDDLTITNTIDNSSIKLLSDKVEFDVGESIVTIDSDSMNAGFKQIKNLQAGSEATDAVTLMQARSMLQNSYLPKEEITINNNAFVVSPELMGKNLFINASGLESSLILDYSTMEDKSTIQLTYGSFEKPAIPIYLRSGEAEQRYLLTGTATIGLYGDTWTLLSDGSGTFIGTDIPDSFRANEEFSQFTSIIAGEGLASNLDAFGTLTLSVLNSSGTDYHFNMQDNVIVKTVDKKPVATELIERDGDLHIPRSLHLGETSIEAAGELVTINNRPIVTQDISVLGDLQAPYIFKETNSSGTFLNTSNIDYAYVRADGQDFSVNSDTYGYLKIKQESLGVHCDGQQYGLVLTILDNHDREVYSLKDSRPVSSGSKHVFRNSNIYLRTNSNYTLKVTDFDGYAVGLLGSMGIQSIAFEYQHEVKENLITQSDVVIPETPTVQHIKTHRISDKTDASGIEFNPVGLIEIDCKVDVQDHEIMNIAEASHGSSAVPLKQVNSLLKDLEVAGGITVDGNHTINLTTDDTLVSTYDQTTQTTTLTALGNTQPDGSVFPIVSEDMTGKLVEFANDSGTAVRATITTVQALMDGINNANQLADKAETKAIAADATAGTALAATGANSGLIAKQSLTLDRMRLEIDGNSAATLRNGRSITQTRREMDVIDRRTQRHETEIKGHDTWIEGANANFEQLGVNLEIVYDDVAELQTSMTDLGTEVGVIQNFPLEAMARGEYEEVVSVADSFESASTSHYMTPRGTEVEYHLPPDARTTLSDYTISIKSNGSKHEVFKASVEHLSAVNRQMKNLVDGTDNADAATIGQVKKYLLEIGDRLDVIETELGIAPPPEVFSIYSGRIPDKTTDNPNDIISAGNVQHNITEETMLEGSDGTGYLIQGHDPETLGNASYSIIAYLKM